MNVLQISHDYAGPFRSVCRQYSSAFGEHHVTTVYLCGEPDCAVAEATGGNDVRFLGMSPASLRGIKIGAMRKLARIYREREFDVVVAHRYKPIYLAGVMRYFFPAAALLGVIHEHEVLRRPTRKLFVNFWQRRLICIGVSESVTANIREICGPLAGRSFTLPGAIDPAAASRFLPRDAARSQLGIERAPFVFGTVGRLVAKKDHETLIRAFAALEADAMLVLVGDGPAREHLQQVATELGVADRVVFAGHVENAATVLAAFDAFVFPSGREEAFGIALLEAMLAEVPIVCSRAPGPLSVVGDAALLFEPGDIAALTARLAEIRRLDDPARLALGEAGRARLNERFTLAAFRDRLWAIPQLR
ncbi:MAG: glycosyltransferase, partial [Pseudomonadales bacterium]|nr:glycosyltransferase [Pseudomonadales bacterium]